METLVHSDYFLTECIFNFKVLNYCIQAYV